MNLALFPGTEAHANYGRATFTCRLEPHTSGLACPSPPFSAGQTPPPHLTTSGGASPSRAKRRALHHHLRVLGSTGLLMSLPCLGLVVRRHTSHPLHISPTGKLPKLNFPYFNGENSRLWISRVEHYLEMYHVDPSEWVGLAAYHCTYSAGR